MGMKQITVLLFLFCFSLLGNFTSCMGGQASMWWSKTITASGIPEQCLAALPRHTVLSGLLPSLLKTPTGSKGEGIHAATRPRRTISFNPECLWWWPALYSSSKHADQELLPLLHIAHIDVARILGHPTEGQLPLWVRYHLIGDQGSRWIVLMFFIWYCWHLLRLALPRSRISSATSVSVLVVPGYFWQAPLTIIELQFPWRSDWTWEPRISFFSVLITSQR